MAIPAIQHLTMRNVRAEFEGGFARSNQYQVYIDNGWGTDIRGDTPFLIHISKIPQLKEIYGFEWGPDFKRKLAFSCANATLPSSTFATGEVKDNFQGVAEEFAHTRINTDIDFSFYVDRNYTVLMFFEAWMNFISGGNSGPANNDEPSIYDNRAGYYRRFQYPKHYKNATGVYIKKFEKNYIVPGETSITYQLINAFPKSITSIPLQYGEAEVVKVTVTMNYDRYRIFREYAYESADQINQQQSNYQKAIDPSTSKGDIKGTKTLGQSGAGVRDPFGNISDFGSIS